MRCEELFGLISDSTDVMIVDTEGHVLSYYDGKNSIDKKFNSAEIIRVETGRISWGHGKHAICITIADLKEGNKKLSREEFVDAAVAFYKAKGFKDTTVVFDRIQVRHNGSTAFISCKSYGDYLAGANLEQTFKRMGDILGDFD